MAPDKFLLVLAYLFQKVNYDDFESPTEKKKKAHGSKDEDGERENETETEDEKENESESADESIQEISEYEKLRLKNIEENRRVLM